MDAGLGVRIALNADGLARTLARAGVGGGPLTADGQAAEMPDAAVTFDTLKAFEVHADFAAQIALDHILAVLDRVNDLRELLLVQILGADGGIDFGLLED